MPKLIYGIHPPLASPREHPNPASPPLSYVSGFLSPKTPFPTFCCSWVAKIYFWHWAQLFPLSSFILWSVLKDNFGCLFLHITFLIKFSIFLQRPYVPYFVLQHDHAEAQTGFRCPKCDARRPTLMHCIWLCTHIAKFWDKVGRCIRLMAGFDTPQDPLLYIFRSLDDSLGTGQGRLSFVPQWVHTCLLAERRLIMKHWANLNSPTVAEVKDTIKHVFTL